MHLKVFRIKFTVKALKLFYRLRHLAGLCDHIAAVNINGKLSFLVHFFQSSVNSLMKIIAFRNTGIKDTHDPCIYRKIDPTF